MKKWLEKTNLKMQQWMQGRYGIDELSRFTYILSLVIVILSLFNPLRFLSILALALMLWSCIRCYSKNLSKRRHERDIYLKITAAMKSWGRLQKDKWRDRKDYRYFRCKQCKATLRVPKGKGTIRVRCPKCHAELQKKT